MSATESSMPTSGRWGWYKDHLGVERQRMSKLLDHLDTDRFYLDRWKAGQVVVGMASRDDLVVAAKAIGRPGRDGFDRSQKKSIYDIAAKASEAAVDMDGAVLGNAVHTLTERLDRGEPLAELVAGLPYPWNQSLQAYEALRRLNGWRNVEIERTVDIDKLDVRGSFDRIDLIPGLAGLLGPGACQYGHALDDHGEAGALPVIVDVKTEEHPYKNGIHIAPQLAGYSRARKMWLPIGVDGKPEYVPMPCVRQDVGVVVHVRDGDAVPYFVNLLEGWVAVVAAAQQRDRQKRAKLALGVIGCWFAPVPGVKRPAPAELAVDAAVMRDSRAVLATMPPAVEAPIGTTVNVGDMAFTKHAMEAQAFGTPPPVTDTRALPTPVGPPSFGVDGQTIATAQGMSDGTTQYTVYDAPIPAEAWSAANTTLGLAPTPEAIARETEETLRRGLIAAIWQCDSRDALAALYARQEEIGHPVAWSGAVAMAGEARLRIVECVQRAMHTAGCMKCACGWVPSARP